MAKSRSLPTIAARKPAPAKLNEAKPLIAKFEDNKYSYFVPRSLQRDGRDRLQRNFSLSKIHKDNKVVMSFGDGTGFRSQCSGSGWWPEGTYAGDMPTQYRVSHTPPICRR